MKRRRLQNLAKWPDCAVPALEKLRFLRHFARWVGTRPTRGAKLLLIYSTWRGLMRKLIKTAGLAVAFAAMAVSSASAATGPVMLTSTTPTGIGSNTAAV